MAIFTGSAVALVTPFKEDGSVDYGQLKFLVEYHVAHKTDAIVICGTTGEASTMTEEEHMEVIQKCCEYVNKRIPVIAGTGSNCTETAVKLSQAAQKVGADALLVVTPYYNKATQNGLIRHYSTIAQAVDIPIIMYNVPGRTGCNIQPATAVAIAKQNENVVAIKEASGDISQVAKLAQLADGCIDIYSGNDNQIVPLLSLGGKGVISVTANIIPEDTHDMVIKYLEGDVAGSLALQLKSIDLCDAMFCEVNPIPVKKAVELAGLCNGYVRMPMTEAEPASVEKIKKAMMEYGITLVC
ncbi:MAG: 4-hydroxy-tetrahydrodipicolinate synthase [Lachnospiraceae bacterium]|nr:4-hydroxy-tetrahydrodipicolinate synthase [Lachnospiraceae bacterium]